MKKYIFISLLSVAIFTNNSLLSMNTIPEIDSDTPPSIVHFCSLCNRTPFPIDSEKAGKRVFYDLPELILRITEYLSIKDFLTFSRTSKTNRNVTYQTRYLSRYIEEEESFISLDPQVCIKKLYQDYMGLFGDPQNTYLITMPQMKKFFSRVNAEAVTGEELMLSYSFSIGGNQLVLEDRNKGGFCQSLYLTQYFPLKFVQFRTNVWIVDPLDTLLDAFRNITIKKLEEK